MDIEPHLHSDTSNSAPELFDNLSLLELPNSSQGISSRGRFVASLVAVGALAFLVKDIRAVAGNIRTVAGSSMNPTLYDGALITYLPGEGLFGVNRFSLCTFTVPCEDLHDTVYIKRVIGLPGETVEYSFGNLFVNGNQVSEEGFKTQGVTSDFGPLQVPDDRVLVLGDNREVSLDSRWFGTVPILECDLKTPIVISVGDRSKESLSSILDVEELASLSPSRDFLLYLSYLNSIEPSDRSDGSIMDQLIALSRMIAEQDEYLVQVWPIFAEEVVSLLEVYKEPFLEHIARTDYCFHAEYSEVFSLALKKAKAALSESAPKETE